MKLIIINGPCGVGKSTLAAKVHDTMLLSFLLDIDAQARYISHYREYTEERKEITTALAKAIIDTLFRLGRDVIIDKMIFDTATLDAYQAVAAKRGAVTREIILWAPKETVMRRANDRGWRDGGLLTPEKCELFWDKIDALKIQRPNALIIDVTNKDENQVLEETLSKL